MRIQKGISVAMVDLDTMSITETVGNVDTVSMRLTVNVKGLSVGKHFS